MKTTQAIRDDLRSFLKCRYTSYGCYPLFAITTDGGCLCADCCREEIRNILRSTFMKPVSDGWNIAAITVNWEDPNLRCCHCNNQIESAYAEDSASEE